MGNTPEELARRRELFRRHRERAHDDSDPVRLDYHGVVVDDLDLTGALLDRADLSDAVLLRCNLRSASLREAKLERARLPRTDLAGALLVDAQMAFAMLEKASLWGADLRNADLSHADLTDCELANADLSGARLRDVHGEPGDTTNCRMDSRTFFGSAWTVDDVIRWRQRGARFTDPERLPANVQALWKDLGGEPFVHLRIDDPEGLVDMTRIRQLIHQTFGPWIRLIPTVDARMGHYTRVRLSGERYEDLVDLAVRLSRGIPPDAIKLVSTGLSPFSELLDYLEGEVSTLRSNLARALPYWSPDDWRSPLQEILHALCEGSTDTLRALVNRLLPMMEARDITMDLPQGGASWRMVVDNLLDQLERKQAVEVWCKQLSAHDKSLRPNIDQVLIAWSLANSPG